MSKSGFGAGLGALAVPMMALVVSVPQAAAMLMLMGLAVFRRDVDLAPLPFAPVGVLAGAWLTRRIQPGLFHQLVYAGMLLTGLKLLWDAART